MGNLVNLIAGVLFGFGLILSGMTDPAKVINFLDLTGTWDPSLAFVMAGAIAVTATGYALALHRSEPVLEPRFDLPPTTPIDTRLISGAAIFGLGWGLSGLCPGPALTSLPLAAPGTLAFVPAMLASIGIARYFANRPRVCEDG
jgi:uncharacterized membrane protein YedE/YeeE